MRWSRLVHLAALAIFLPTCWAYYVRVKGTLAPGQFVFNASLGHGWTYELDSGRTSKSVQKLVTVDHSEGIVRLKHGINCPQSIVLFVECRSFKLSGSTTDYVSIPVSIHCPSKHKHGTIEHQTANTIVSVSASDEMANESDTVVCFRRSQPILNVESLVPVSVRNNCVVKFQKPFDSSYGVEGAGGDLVARKDFCCPYGQWVVRLVVQIGCDPAEAYQLQSMEIIFHLNGVSNELVSMPRVRRRGRREMRNLPPYFERALYAVIVPEEKGKGYIVTTMGAKDPNGDEIIYSLHAVMDSRSQSMFSIDSVSGVVKTTVGLDREYMDVHYLRVTAVDNGTPAKSGTATLQVSVADENDHAPVFEQPTYEASIRESATVGSTVVTTRATDQDTASNSDIEYSLLNPGAQNEVFKIDPRTGIVTTRGHLDRETTSYYSLIVQATDMGPVTDRKSVTCAVEITVLDDNDNYPQFTEKSYTAEVPEDINYMNNPIIASVKAYDMDAGINAGLRYTLIGGNTQGHFVMDSLTGDISVIAPLDYESARSYRLVVRAQDGGSPPRSNTTQVLVKVTDVNDNDPKFYTSLFQESVMENVPSGHNIVRVQAYDSDEGPNAEITYSLQGGLDDMPLTVDVDTGWIVTTRQLDREQGAYYDFSVVATDHGNPPRSSTASVILRVQDMNDNDPVFEPKMYDAVISEVDPPGTPVVSVTATDKDENSRLIYHLTNGNVRGRFNVISQNGRGLISVGQPLDYKMEKKFVLTVTATDSGGRMDTATIYINVSDANTHRPVFDKTPYTASVPEDAAIGTTVLVVEAADGDVGDNARIIYTMDDVPEFRIDAATGALITTRSLDREASAGYTVVVTAQDKGKPPLSDTTNVEIEVSDVNDNPPAFLTITYSHSISEDALIGTSVLQLQAADIDLGLNGQVRYTFTGGNDGDGAFSVDPTSGIIRTSRMLDRESVPVYHLVAYAVDRGSPSLSSSVSVTVYVEDINDNPPRFESDKIKLFVPENSPIGWTVGEVKAYDPDEGPNGEIQYSIVGGPDADAFTLVSRPGEPAELTIRVDTDYESVKKKYSVIVRASSPPLRNDVDVEVWVTDVNDNAPVLRDFSIIFNNYKNYFPVGSVGKVPAYDADVTDNLRYRVISGNNANLLYVNETSGDIVLSPSLNTNVPIHAVMEVSVFDGVNEVLAQCQLVVRLVTEAMLFNSVTIRLNQMTQTSFLSPLFDFFVEGLAAIIPCPKEHIFIFNVQDDTDVEGRILNVSFSARRPRSREPEDFLSPQFLQERVYLNRAVLAKLAGVQVLPFDDTLCVREPCVNYEECLSVLKFGNASGFISSDSILFRPIYPVSTFACRCPQGFTGMNRKYECDTEVDLCFSSPCGSNGTCLRKESSYVCVCKEGFTGANCEVNMWKDRCDEISFSKEGTGICRGDSECANLIEGGFVCENCTYNSWSTPQCQLRARSFSRGTFLTFPALRQRHRLNIKLRFATRERNALLLYNGRYNDQHDFIALEISGGQVVFSFSLGVNVTKVVTSVPGAAGVSDGQWHHLQLSYLNRTASLSVDHCDSALAINFVDTLPNYKCASTAFFQLEPRCADLMQTCYRFLDLTGPLQVGGLPSLPSDFQVANQHFVGCIMDLHIDHQLLDLNSFVANNGSIPGCAEKKGFCNPVNPCQNGGTCEEGWSSFICRCPLGFSEVDCSENLWNKLDRGVEPAKHFSGNGFLILTPHLRPVQMPWVNSLSFRTRQPRGLLIRIQLGPSSYVSLEVVNERVQYQYDDQKVTLSDVSVSDGRWHHVEAKWTGNSLWLNLDYGQFEVTQEMEGSIRGQFVGKVSIGGLESSDIDDPVFGFDGCIQAVQIGTSKESWLRPTVESNVKEGCHVSDPCGSNPCPPNSECSDEWGGAYKCHCKPGFVGEQCLPICELNPCSPGSRCLSSDESQASAPSHLTAGGHGNIHRGYSCSCDTLHSGEYCQVPLDQPCPSNWWGYPICGPCNCAVEKGYDADCNKTTGECICEENHFQPLASDICFDCDCYATGSFSNRCDPITGQCRCRNGVIGRRCDTCSNPFAEVTLRGCEVIYDGCPRSMEEGIWWDRTYFDQEAIHSCPKGAVGKAFRFCEKDGGWQKPNLFNCTSEAFLDLGTQLIIKERNKLPLSTYLSIKLSSELRGALNSTAFLYGRDVLIVGRFVRHILRYETRQAGLNLTHRQDRHFIRNLVEVISQILEPSHLDHWEKIVSLAGYGPENILLLLEKYSNTLVRNQGDTFTEPFEVVAPNLVFGMDTVSTGDMWSFTTTGNLSYTSLVVDQSSEFLDSSLQNEEAGPAVVIPKYNNYPVRQNHKDGTTNAVIPLSLLGVKAQPTSLNPTAMERDKAVIAYAIYPTMGKLLPPFYDPSIRPRFGVPVQVNSPVMTLVVQAVNSSTPLGQNLPHKVRLRLPIYTPEGFTSPQCAFWDFAAGNRGKWSTAGCSMEYSEMPSARGKSSESAFVNCSCNHLTSYALLMDATHREYLAEESLLQDVVSYIGLLMSLFLLLLAFIALCLLRGLQTNSNTIHKNLVASIFFAHLIFLTALKARRPLVQQEFPCKVVAILLHYFFLCIFSWMLLEGIHLYRMLIEMKDINHGQMRFYYSIGYGTPAIVVGLSVGVRADQYGNYFFCWLSIYESVIWSLVGPICFVVVINLAVFALAVRASVQIKESVTDFGNLRTLLWLGIVLLPLLGTTWVLAVLSVNESLEILHLAFSVSCLLEGLYVFIGYCVVNRKVRQQLFLAWAQLRGKKVHYEESLSGAHTTASSRSALAYSSNFDVLHRNVGISTSSTTSRSTAKTSSSPYRSDCQLRNTSTSTSGPRLSGSEGKQRKKAYFYKRRGKHREADDPDTGEVTQRRRKKSGEGSESDSDASVDHASLDLASSHSSDEEEYQPGWREKKRAQSKQEITSKPNIVEEAENSQAQLAVQGYNVPAPPSCGSLGPYPQYTSYWSGPSPLQGGTGGGLYSALAASTGPAYVPKESLYLRLGLPSKDTPIQWSQEDLEAQYLQHRNLPDVSLPLVTNSRHTPPTIMEDTTPGSCVSSPGQKLPVPERADSLPSHPTSRNSSRNSHENGLVDSQERINIPPSTQRMVIAPLTTAEISSESDYED